MACRIKLLPHRDWASGLLLTVIALILLSLSKVLYWYVWGRMKQTWYVTKNTCSHYDPLPMMLSPLWKKHSVFFTSTHSLMQKIHNFINIHIELHVVGVSETLLCCTCLWINHHFILPIFLCKLKELIVQLRQNQSNSLSRKSSSEHKQMINQNQISQDHVVVF